MLPFSAVSPGQRWDPCRRYSRWIPAGGMAGSVVVLVRRLWETETLRWICGGHQSWLPPIPPAPSRSTDRQHQHCLRAREEYRTSGPIPDLQNDNLHFNKILRRYVYTHWNLRIAALNSGKGEDRRSHAGRVGKGSLFFERSGSWKSWKPSPAWQPWTPPSELFLDPQQWRLLHLHLFQGLWRSVEGCRMISCYIAGLLKDSLIALKVLGGSVFFFFFLRYNL